MKTVKIIDNPEIKTSELLQKCRDKFSVWSYWNDDELDKNFPPPQEETIREFRNEPEALERIGESWNDLKDVRENMMTSREYAIFFIKYYEETEEYLDKKGWTTFREALPDGDVAYGFWCAGAGKMSFGWSSADYCNPRIGFRLAISPIPSTSSSSPLDSAIKIVKEANYLVIKII